MYKISGEDIKFIKKTMKNWWVELTAEEKDLAEMKIHWAIFKEDVLSPLLLVIAMMTLNHILRQCTGEYKFSKLPEKDQSQNVHGWHQNVCQTETELETLIQAVRIYNQNIR